MPLAFIDSAISIRHHTLTLQLSLVKLPWILISRRRIKSESMALDFAIIKLSFVVRTIGHDKFTMTYSQEKSKYL